MTAFRERFGLTVDGVTVDGVTVDGMAVDGEVVEVPPDRLAAAVEAVLVTSDVPVTVAALAELLHVDADVVRAVLRELADDYDEHRHGFGLLAVAGGWRLSTRPEFAGLLVRHLADGQRVRLTNAALEALTVVAYQQPVTRALVSSVRGVASDGVLRTLVGRGLIEECGADEGGALRYRTTPAFLERLGLDTLADLVPLAPHLPELADLAEPADNAAVGSGPAPVPAPEQHQETG